MAKKIFKRFTVDGQKLLSSGKLAVLGSRIHDPNLWHLNRNSVARAFFAGLFAGFAFILFPFQMLIAAIIAIWLRGNLPISVGLVWVSNPLTSPPILYAALKIGSFFIPNTVNFDLNALLSFDWSHDSFLSEASNLFRIIKDAWRPLLLGTFIIGTAFGITGYFAIQIFWRWHVIRTWNKRQLDRIKKRL